MSCCQLLTLFGPIRDRNITFCIDTSGSTYHSLPMVKRHLIGFLENRAQQKAAGMFNLIEFSSTVHLWADKMVNCNPATVSVAKEWVHKLDAKTGTNTLDALLAAYADRNCDAVVLVTDGRPDTPTDDMLEYVIHASRGRPLYTAYVIGSEDCHDTHEATQLYRALAEQTLGGLDIVIMSRRGGDIERITPVYHAGTDRERFIRTTSGAVYVNPPPQIPGAVYMHPAPPTTSAVCVHPPPTAPGAVYMHPVPRPPNAVYMHPAPTTAVPMDTTLYHPLRHAHCDMSFWEESWPSYMVVGPRVYSTRDSLVPIPSIAWSRHRPLRIRSDGRIVDHCSSGFDPIEVEVCYAPDAGAMLVGRHVLARRDTDGFYYRGTVRSQIMAHKFLVEFSPCSHGKYSSTTYQETPLYDIIHWDDALRHSIVPGDKVLAAWEPSGDRYGPGEVLQGVERRGDIGLGPDSPLTIVFFNGKTATVPANKAIWTPRAMHERVKFELVMPVTARKFLEEESEEYPRRTLPGYPECGMIPRAPNCEIVMPRMLFDRWPYFVPLYPIFRKHTPDDHATAVRSDHLNSLVDAETTTYDLTQKVESQIAQYRDFVEQPRLLPRRSRCHSASVRVRAEVDEDGLSDCSDDLEAEMAAIEGELDELLHLHDRAGHEIKGDPTRRCGKMRHDASTNTDLSLGMRSMRESSYYQPTRKAKAKTGPWRYWPAEPPIQLKPNKHEPYDDSGAPISIETVKMRSDAQQKHWEAAQRSAIPVYQCPGRAPKTAAFETRISRLRAQRDNLDNMYDKARRDKSYAREKHLMERIDQLERRCDAQHLYRKAEVRDRFHHERQRLEEQATALQRTRSAKQHVEGQLRAAYQERIRDREQEKLDARRAQVMRREAEKLGQEMDRDLKTMRLQASKEIKQQAQWQNHRSQIFNHEHADQTREMRAREAKIQRIEQFRNAETQSHRMKDMGTQVAEQKGAMFRASLFN